MGLDRLGKFALFSIDPFAPFIDPGEIGAVTGAEPPARTTATSKAAHAGVRRAHTKASLDRVAPNATNT